MGWISGWIMDYSLHLMHSVEGKAVVLLKHMISIDGFGSTGV